MLPVMVAPAVQMFPAFTSGLGLSIDKLVAILQEDRNLKPLQSSLSQSLIPLARTTEMKTDL